MTTVVLILAALFLTALTIWFGFPQLVVRLIQGLMRSSSGLWEKSRTVDGITWPYLEGGPAAADTLVLVHGFGGDKDQWVQYAGHLTKTYHVIVPDLPGFGDNTKDPALTYHTGTQAERLRAFLKALGVERFHLAGNSMGGMIALRYAAAHPEELLSMALFNNAGIIGKEKTELELALDEGKNLLSVSEPADIDRLLGFLAYEPLKVPGPFKKVMFGKAKAAEDLHNKIFFDELAVEALQDAFNDRLAEIHVPTLVVWGTHDRLLHVTCADVLKAGLPKNHCVIFEETGHVPMMERPKESAAEHQEFVERVKSGAYA